MLRPTNKSYDVAKTIKSTMSGHTFHQHYHILLDLIDFIPKKEITYLEIGVFNGASLSLVLQSPKVTKAYGVDPLILAHQEEHVNANLLKFNIHNTPVTIIKDFSCNPGTLRQIPENGIDLLFIDGDHSAKGVIADFENYYRRMAPGGYIVFDDYLDNLHSPQVRHAVDLIVANMRADKYERKFEIIGCLDNITDDYWDIPREGGNNDFIVKVIN